MLLQLGLYYIQGRLLHFGLLHRSPPGEFLVFLLVLS